MSMECLISKKKLCHGCVIKTEPNNNFHGNCSPKEGSLEERFDEIFRIYLIAGGYPEREGLEKGFKDFIRQEISLAEKRTEERMVKAVEEELRLITKDKKNEWAVTVVDTYERAIVALTNARKHI